MKSWKKDSVLVSSEEGIQQRDRGSEVGRVFIRNEVHVEEDAGGLEVSGTLLGWLMLLIWAPFSGFLLANHLACCPYLI